MASTLTPTQFAAELKSIGTVASRPKLRDALAECENAIMAGVAKNFLMEQAAGGERWPARKDPVPRHPLLNLTGTLLDSATSENASYHVRRISDTTLETGTNLVYAATHQYGDPGRNIAQREFLDVPEGVLEECGEIIAEAMLAQMLGGPV